MLTIQDIRNTEQIYRYQMQFPAPYFFPVDYESWEQSFLRDIDGEGRPLFSRLWGKAAYEGDSLVGFIQYGCTAFGFDSRGEISAAVSYPVIRSLYFDEGREDAGRQLLQAALQEFADQETVYAFFHYFGMSCFARHGKLFEQFGWIKELLEASGFTIEHENVYYSSALQGPAASDVEIRSGSMTGGNQQSLDFLLSQTPVGGCEVHFLDSKGIAYLRWIYIGENLQNQGVGSACMQALKKWLYDRGYTRLDTDTALNNLRAQRYYEKNGFTREGITRSYYRK